MCNVYLCVLFIEWEMLTINAIDSSFFSLKKSFLTLPFLPIIIFLLSHSIFQSVCLMQNDLIQFQLAWVFVKTNQRFIYADFVYLHVREYVRVRVSGWVLACVWLWVFSYALICIPFEWKIHWFGHQAIESYHWHPISPTANTIATATAITATLAHQRCAHMSLFSGQHSNKMKINTRSLMLSFAYINSSTWDTKKSKSQ